MVDAVNPQEQRQERAPEPRAEVKPEAQEPSADDIVSRVVKADPPKEEAGANGNKPGFNRNDIEKITDPQAKKYAEDAYKELERGYNKKYQELAELRKQVESQLSENSHWTPERVQKLLNDPTFVQSAQAVAGQSSTPSGAGLTDEEYSALSDAEKSKLNSIVQNQQSLAAQLQSMRTQQEDELLKHKYGSNYVSDKISQLQHDLLAGKVQATREHLHKVVDYEDAVKRAYQLGRSDEKAGKSEKQSAITPEGVTTTPAAELPEFPKNMSGIEKFKILAQRRLKEFNESGKLAR